MKQGAILLAAALAVNALPAAAQDAPAGPSQDAAYHNRQAGALAQRAAEGWNRLEGGLLWTRIAGDGVGPKPSIADDVTVHYEGSFVDGKVFDSSYARGESASFPLSGLIRAWQLAIPQMAVGDTIMLAVPDSMGYGYAGRGPIPGGATLIFKVELLGIGDEGEAQPVCSSENGDC